MHILYPCVLLNIGCLTYNRSMRKTIITPGEYYHVVNRGVNKQKLFIDKRDYVRFLFLILYFQSPITFINLGRHVSYFVKHQMFNISEQENIIKNRSVYLHNFCIMPNHFHLLLSESIDGGISRYLQRIQNGYGKYFNTRYQKNGHVFQGVFRAVHMQDNEQLLHTSAYIHKNPQELMSDRHDLETYPWSSYRDYIGQNRWRKLIESTIILDQFETKEDYHTFVKTSSAKEIPTDKDVKHLMFNT